jgi:hypothetical protein
MLDKERWIYDPARCLRKTCKYPMLEDSQLGGYYIKGHKPIVFGEDEEKGDDSEVLPQIQLSRRSRKIVKKGKYDMQEEEKDDEDSVASVVAVPTPKRKRTAPDAPIAPIAPPNVRSMVPPTPRVTTPLLNRTNNRRAPGSSSSASSAHLSSSLTSSPSVSAMPTPSDDAIGELIEKHMKVFVGVMLRNQRDIVQESQRQLEETVKQAMTKHQAEIAAMKASLMPAPKRSDRRDMPSFLPSPPPILPPQQKQCMYV